MGGTSSAATFRFASSAIFNGGESICKTPETQLSVTRTSSSSSRSNMAWESSSSCSQAISHGRLAVESSRPETYRTSRGISIISRSIQSEYQSAEICSSVLIETSAQLGRVLRACS